MTDWAAVHPGADWSTALALVTIYVVMVRSTHDPLAELDHSTRVSYAQTVASLAGGLFGFSATAAAIIYAFGPGRRLQRVLKLKGRQITDLIISCIAGLAFVTLVVTTAMAFDGGVHASGSRYVYVAAMVVITARLSRLIWLLRYMLRAAAADAAETPVEPAGGPWTPHTVVPGEYLTAPRRPGVTPRA